MAEKTSEKRLGRGLASLIGELDQPVTADAETGKEAPSLVAKRPDRRVSIEQIQANPDNPRQDFSDFDLDDLASSLGRHGMIQPILVRPSAGTKDRFEIIAGERRWRAAQRAGLHDVPVIVREVDDHEALELAIVENVQRDDLNPIEEALGYRQLMEQYDYIQDDLAKALGKSRSHVANILRLLKLPEGVQLYIRAGQLTTGQARTLITIDDPETLARRAVKESLSARQLEKIVQDMRNGENRKAAKEAKPSKSIPKDADTRALEKRLGDKLGFKVAIDHRAHGTGFLKIAYKNLDQLDDIILRLAGN